jgi:CheY-like chemotaxis protein
MAQVAFVVDDSILVRHTLCRFLEARGYAVEAAGDGLEALKLLERVRPNLIITDLELPRMNGNEFIAALKATPDTASIPVVVLAAKSAATARPEPVANFTVFKDIDLVGALGRALDALTPAQA